MIRMLLSAITIAVGFALAFLAGVGVATFLAASKFVLAAICFGAMFLFIVLSFYIVLEIIN